MGHTLAFHHILIRHNYVLIELCIFYIDITCKTLSAIYLHIFYSQEIGSRQRLLVPVCSIVVVVCCVTFTLIYIRSVFRRFAFWITTGLCVFLCIMSIVFNLLHTATTSVAGLPLAFYMILVIYTCVPASVAPLVLIVVGYMVVHTTSSALLANSHTQYMGHQVRISSDIEIIFRSGIHNHDG